MNHSWIATRLILRALLGPLTMSLATLGGILFLTQILRMATEMAGRGLAVGDLFIVVLDLIPFFAGNVIPIGAGVAVLMTGSILHREGIWDGLRAAGMGPAQLLPPFLIIALPLTLIGLASAHYYGPKAMTHQAEVITDARTRLAPENLPPGQFFETRGGLTLYAQGQDDSGNYKGLLIATDDTWLWAKRGGWQRGEDGRWNIALEDGTLLRQLEEDGSEVTRFAQVVVQDPLAIVGSGRAFKAGILGETTWELFQHDPDWQNIALARSTLPLTIPLIMLAMSGFVFADRRSGKGGLGILAGIGVLLAVYLLNASASDIVTARHMSTLWLPVFPLLPLLPAIALSLHRLRLGGLARW
ncbi:MAG: hypothetical protein COX57_03355 [Alphaproteobacteria bacterium CG_4_10_14_0_2_um_filter_63_37]|nr:MAG: hypothetical protein AUJ55_05740 [Proteobacteria bacterium CG1_02_64_396]PJA25440.1 MAG: hypothetical protein COX57_03355 [Alphaproteobacteria bacterium CG_4_10_14_0_2_um_filter_63_37]